MAPLALIFAAFLIFIPQHVSAAEAQMKKKVAPVVVKGTPECMTAYKKCLAAKEVALAPRKIAPAGQPQDENWKTDVKACAIACEEAEKKCATTLKVTKSDNEQRDQHPYTISRQYKSACKALFSGKKK